MRNIILFERDDHRFILLNESEPEEEEGIRSNQYLILHGETGVLLDPGGFSTMPRVLAELYRYINPSRIRAIILSHQDPDIVGGLAAWLQIVDAPVYISRIWTRFLPHYGLPGLSSSLVPVPDEGMDLSIVPGFPLSLVPAHFLHSEGQMNVFDPQARILFTGDIGAAIMPPDRDDPFVGDFSSHLPYIESFHRRYMGSRRACRTWARTIEPYAPVMLAPQHGPVYRGESVSGFINWLSDLECGIDLLPAEGWKPGGSLP
uniref:Putative metallo-beta-lactamase family protein n=1 Tax=Leptospirillum sp. Group II '5-way CG' TaxID=419541 RepID=B6AS69_9BACT|nr:MAG: Putative metallo-beta-lactamase family protein [Leptospirillum sp. Group II '5-way CG']